MMLYSIEGRLGLIKLLHVLNYIDAQEETNRMLDNTILFEYYNPTYTFLLNYIQARMLLDWVE